MAVLEEAAAFNSISVGRNSGGFQSKQDDCKDSDAEFMTDVLSAIQTHYGETSIRAKFQDYIFRFVRLTAIYEEQVYHHTNIAAGSDELGGLGHGPVFQDDASKQRELNASASRIEGWRKTISYKYYQRVNT
jgi:hypothetical protein